MQEKYVDGSNGLTTRQLRVLTFIQRYNETFNYAPTVREIRDSLGISSTSVVTSDLAVLEDEGYIERVYRAARTLKVTRNGRDLLWSRDVRYHDRQHQAS